MTTQRVVKFGLDGREGLRKGAQTLADAVSVTMGAKGRNVVIKKGNDPVHVTKDGATVAKSVYPHNRLEAIGAELLREAATKTAEVSGDSTTAATVLAMSLINQCLDAVEQGQNPISIKSGIESGVKKVVERLKELSKPLEDYDTLLNVATISANNDAVLGKVIADVVHKVGQYGVVTIENSNSTATRGKVLEGMVVDSGYLRREFINDIAREEVVYEDPYILVCDAELTTMTPEFVSVMESALIENRPLVIIAKEINGNLLSVLMLNKVQKGYPIVAIKAPNVEEIQKQLMEDICISTGATMIGEVQGIPYSKFEKHHFGTCEKIIVTESTTVFIKGAGNEKKISDRVASITHLLSESTNERQQAFLKRRIANIKDGVGMIHVGALTPAELKEKMDRVEDAVCATQAAQEEGVVAGGGTTLRTISNEIDKEENDYIGEQIVYKACVAPFRQILSNAGHDMPNAVPDFKYGTGIDVRTMQEVDMFNAGIIDPTKAIRVALENAASVACLFLTTECVSYEAEVASGN